MKFVPAFPMRVLTTIALVACTTAAFAGPVSPVPPPTTRFGSTNIENLVAGPVSPVPPPTTKFGSTNIENLVAGPVSPVPPPTTKFGSTNIESLS
jgi:hypothetical protein